MSTNKRAEALAHAGLISKENKELDLAVQFMERASLMFQENGTPDTAALCLEKAAKYDEAVDCFKKEISFYAAAENYAMIAKLVLGVILIKLHVGDYVAADEFFRSATKFPQFIESEEAGAVQELLTAYDDGDEEAARRVLSLPLIKYMDNVFNKLARGLEIPGGMRVGGAGGGAPNVTDSLGGGTHQAAPLTAPAQLDDDEMEEGLC
ncbi:SNAG-like protein [Mya arenaria]|uniref:Gamma-soluble NSF attachment protein n=1 Tax=Mya arenaria TaxID=6604 RepID=A0ABY7EP39_MYAAR|nr:SNAG-like protein [Mya arenaria]